MSVENTVSEKTAKELFLDNLRSETAEAHKNLERLPASAAILQPGVTHEKYRHYLELMYPQVYDLEQNIFPLIADIIPDLEERRKEPLIKADLHALGNTAPNVADLPFTSADLPFPAAFAMGIMYVMEGSTLGGRVILKHVQPLLGLEEDTDARFFGGYKSQTGSYWKKFVDVLTSYAVEYGAEQEVIEGANFAFNAIYEFMGQKSAN